jgi:hypothetical protein
MVRQTSAKSIAILIATNSKLHSERQKYMHGLARDCQRHLTTLIAQFSVLSNTENCAMSVAGVAAISCLWLLKQ